ncbi:MAG TPA: cytochrome c oxidase assembly protein [Bryobacteraceae bacterium]
MESIASAALTSWTLDWRATAVLAGTAVVYLRGWLRGRRLIKGERDHQRLGAFLAGIAVLFLALESPLDAFDSLFLSAHMTQHLLLMMVAPPLVLFGHPILPLLRGLPKRFVKEGLGPFLTWPTLRKIASLATSPVAAWLVFASSTILWHLPKFYELALSSPAWHGVQHASFFWSGILFWWPIIQPGPGKPRWPKWVAIPYLLFADIVNTALSAFFVFSGTLLYPSYSAVRASGLSAQDDQILAGLIMWVPGSIVYLVPAFVLMMRVLGGTGIRRAVRVMRVKRPPPRANRALWQLTPRMRRVAQAAMLLLALAVMADGFFGSQVTALNMAGVLPWIHWRGLSVLALLMIGNLFCMTCPFTLVRDFGRKVLPAKLRWPRPLRTKWLPVALFAIYLWAYEAFGLWNSPWLTAWIIAGYFATALAVDGIFRGASFCKYVCPIGQFHFVSSLVSPREVAVRSAAVCQSCRTHDCIRGNEHARGCELYLFQPKKAGNLDCTFCLDCVKACPHDNVGLLPVLPAQTLVTDVYRSSLGRLSKRTDMAALVLLFVFGAFVNAAGMVAPVMAWEHGWHSRLGIDSMPLIVGIFVFAGALLLPAAAVTCCGLLTRQRMDALRRFVFTLVPIGFAMWAAHLLFHLAASWGIASIEPAQILLLDAGLLLTLYLGWRVAGDALRNAAPWAVMACSLYGAGIWILFQPMQMRGMMP